MDMVPFKRWCFYNVILPGSLLVDRNDTFDPCIACHTAAVRPPGARVLMLLEEHWVLILLVTLIVVSTVGVVLYYHHLRWKTLLRRELELGNIDREQYERLR